MRLPVVFLTALFFISACTSKNKLPNNILAKEQMDSIMTDMMKADEVVSYYSLKDSAYTKPMKREQLYEQVLQLHHTTKTQFKASLQYYQGHPDLLKAIVDTIQKQVDSSGKKPAIDTGRRGVRV